MSDYLVMLEEELADAKRRLASSGEEGKPVIKRQIQEINRDILRLSEIERVDFALKQRRVFFN